MLAPRRCGVCRTFETFCAAFRFFRFALLLLCEAQTLAGRSSIRKAQRLRDLLGAPEIRFLATADPAAGAAAPQERAFNLALCVIVQRVIRGLFEMQFELLRFKVADEETKRFGGVNPRGQLGQLVGREIDIFRPGKPPSSAPQGRQIVRA